MSLSRQPIDNLWRDFLRYQTKILWHSKWDEVHLNSVICAILGKMFDKDRASPQSEIIYPALNRIYYNHKIILTLYKGPHTSLWYENTHPCCHFNAILKLYYQGVSSTSLACLISSADGRTFFSSVSTFFSLPLSNFSTPNLKSKLFSDS